MAKRKNPLKDLDEFLKQEASSIVKPAETSPKTSEASPLTTTEDIIAAISTLAATNPAAYREELFKIIKSSIEQLDHSSAEDKMLINTVLYLKNKDNWKETIKSYWQEHH